MQNAIAFLICVVLWVIVVLNIQGQNRFAAVYDASPIHARSADVNRKMVELLIAGLPLNRPDPHTWYDIYWNVDALRHY